MSPNNRTGDKHDRILDAALKVFARHGFFNSKVSEIARVAGVADGTIYLYFKNKDDILIKAFEETMTMLITRLDEALGALTHPLEKLRTYIRLHFSIVRAHRDLAEVITVELRQSTKFMKEYKNEKFQEYLQRISMIIREGKDQGMIRPEIQPGIIKRGLFGMIDELTLLFVLSKKYSVDQLDQVADQVAEILIRGIQTEKGRATLEEMRKTSGAANGNV